MTRIFCPRRPPGLVAAAVVVALLTPTAPLVRGEEPASATPPASPMLGQLSRETQSLYGNVQAGIVRLQLPTPRWLTEMAAADDPVTKWGQQLSPAVKQGLVNQRKEV